MNKSEKTKNYILETVAPIFNKKGFAGTSLSDLTEATGLTKGSIYGNFNSKEEVALHVFKFAAAKHKKTINHKLQSLTKPIDKIYTMLDFFTEYVMNTPVSGGCVLMNTAIEADDTNPLLKKEVSGELFQTIKYIAAILQEGIDAGELKRELDPEAIAFNVFCALEGALMMSRVQESTKPMQAIVTYWKNQFTQFQTQ